MPRERMTYEQALAEADRLRVALARIVERGNECRFGCGLALGYVAGNCGCAAGSGRIADAALEGSP